MDSAALVARQWGTPLDRKRQQEEFSNAFIQAIAAHAGYSATKPTVDDDSVDWTIAERGGKGTIRSPKLDLQLKSTTASRLDESFPLKRKNYDELRGEDFQVPRILVVVFLPDDEQGWSTAIDESLVLRYSARWVSLRDQPPRENSTTVNVPLPRDALLTHYVLRAMMQRIGEGGMP